MGNDLKVIIVGASGGIGMAFVDALAASEQVTHIHALSRQSKSFKSAKISSSSFDFTDEDNLKATAETLQKHGPFDLIIVTTGLLKNDKITPEKTLRDMSLRAFHESFAINSIGPAITAKYFLPLMRRDRKAVFAALSARVGSISDNRLGGWYAYRASKAALNMILKTLSIEHARRFKEAVIIGLHPGTVDTSLSKPFQSNVPEGKLFTAEFSTNRLLTVIDNVKPNDSGSLFAWDGQRIEY